MSVSQPKPPRRSRGSLSQEEILDASIGIIRDEGLEKLSMRRIAQVLRCSVASPYAYFESQEAIIQALIRKGETHLTSMLREASAATTKDTVYIQLEAIARTYWRFATENRELHKLMINMGIYRKTFQQIPTSYRVFLETLRRGMNSGEIHYPRERYRQIAGTMWAWIYGVLVLEMNDLLRNSDTLDPIGAGIELFQEMLQKGPPETR
ncbi:MAG: TetR/AcrR family transcriptional regulator [bacterium]|nr:TetR/AcrR family transcriptional regulator [bacterium]